MWGECDKKGWQGWNYSAHPKNKEPVLTLVSQTKDLAPQRNIFTQKNYFYSEKYFYSAHPQNKEPVLTLVSQTKDSGSVKKYLFILQLVIIWELIPKTKNPS